MDTTFLPKRSLFSDTQAEVEALSSTAGQALNILQYPDPKLSQVSKAVISDIPNDLRLQSLLNDMAVTLRTANAVGLAAIQVGVDLRALVVRGEDDEVLKVINPRVISTSTKQERSREGCLSFLGLFINVRRPQSVSVEYFDEKGVKQLAEYGSLVGRAIQHEIDHLDGLTFLDRVSSVERSDAFRKNKIAKRKVKAVVRKLSKVRRA